MQTKQALYMFGCEALIVEYGTVFPTPATVRKASEAKFNVN